LPTGVESSIHRYVSKSLNVNAYFLWIFGSLLASLLAYLLAYVLPFFFGHFAMIFLPIEQCNVIFFLGQQATALLLIFSP
jgi:hypothetical protein